MGSIRNTVHYCCVWKGGKVLYAYNNGVDPEIDNLASLCLEKAPSHHKWYFQTMSKKTFGFLMEDGFIYFAIINENLGNPKNLEFLKHVRDEFKKVSKKSSKNSAVLQEKLVPVIKQLITALEHVTETIPSSYPNGQSPSPNDSNSQLDIGASTKAPLLGKSSKQEKRKTRDHVISVAVEDHRKSADKGGSKVDSDNQGGTVAAIQLAKEVSSVNRSSNQSVRTKWCRQVRIVLAVDVAVCLILFIVWIVVCRGTECLR